MLGGVGLFVDATGYWNCFEYVNPCSTAQDVSFVVALVAPWVLAIVLLARSHAIMVFSYVALAVGLTVGLMAWYLGSAELNLDHDFPGNNDIADAKIAALTSPLFVVPVMSAATGLVGGILQFVFERRPTGGTVRFVTS